MDYQILAIATYEVIISMACGMLTLYVSLRIIGRTLLRTADGSLLQEANTAASLFAAMMILAELLIVRQSILPAVDALRAMVAANHQLTALMVATSLGYFLAFYVISLVVSLTCLYLSIMIYIKATTKMDELEELRRNNLSVAVLMSAVVIGMALFIQSPVERLIGSLVNYEAIGRVELAPSTPDPSGAKLYYMPRE